MISAACFRLFDVILTKPEDSDIGMEGSDRGNSRGLAMVYLLGYLLRSYRLAQMVCRPRKNVP
jgi:hypothetical protein